MLIGLAFAAVALLCGLAVSRALNTPVSIAPFSGLASIAVLTTWSAALDLPPAVGTALVVVLALAGAAVAAPAVPRAARLAGDHRLATAILVASIAIPWLLLGVALANVDAPVSTHDGAFHVESVDSLRRGVPVQGWYPMAFHTSVAALLRLTPWLDAARGTLEAAEGLAVLAPVGVFALGLAIGLEPRTASLGGLVLALTYIFPYDDHMWGGWPLATSLLLLLGLWSVAARWIARPSAGLAALGGLMAGAIVLAHGTEVYSAVIGLAVIAGLQWRRLDGRMLVRHVPLAVVGALVCVLPYLSVLMGWAAGGGASSAGTAALDEVGRQARPSAGADMAEFVLGITGAASLIELPFRAAMLVIGARQRRMAILLAGWAAFAGLLFAASFVDLPAVRWLYVTTFPWLVRHRPPQLVVLFASALVASGIATTCAWSWRLRARLAGHPKAFRRLASMGGALLLFFAEGSAVSIFKTLQTVIGNQYVYLSDDQAAMAWLRQHAQPGDVLINDLASDAGIWAPYKAGIPVLLPRSAAGALQAERGPILARLVDLSNSSGIAAQVCALHAAYLYAGSRTVPDDRPLALDRAALARAPDLEQVFSSGDAAVFRVRLACD